MGYPALYLIADPSVYGAIQRPNDAVEQVFFSALERALCAGLGLIQYRDKKATRKERYRIALKLRALTRKAGALLIVNDDIDVAMAISADGVHLGQDDFPPSMARKLMGKEAIIGLSTHNLKQAREAKMEPLDYIGLGPLFETKTKAVPDPVLGLEAIASIVKSVDLPVYAIGGITLDHCAAIRAVGAQGVAVASALKDASSSVIKDWCGALSD